MHTFIEPILGMGKKNIEKEVPKYTSRLIVRLTPQLHKEIAEYAALCGLTTSAYARKRLEGKYPKQRLTDKEMEALNSLSDARGDIQKLFGFLKGRPLTERENILRSEIFMKRWRTSAEVIMNDGYPPLVNDVATSLAIADVAEKEIGRGSVIFMDDPTLARTILRTSRPRCPACTSILAHIKRAKPCRRRCITKTSPRMRSA